MLLHLPHSIRSFLASSRKARLACLMIALLGLLVAPVTRMRSGLRLAQAATAGQDRQQAEAQALGGSRVQPPPNRQDNLILAPSVVTLTDHRVTGAEPPNDCSPPVPKANFSPTDARIYQWTLVSGAQIGDTVRWDFRQPNGSSYFLTDTLTINFNGAVCMSAFINIAGFPAASLTGVWEARVIYNGAMLTSDTFTISSTTLDVIVTDHRTTGTAPADGCATPPLKTTFAPTDERVYQWTLVSNAEAGDRVRWQFIQPDGAVYATSNDLTLSQSGGICFWVSIGIAGQQAAQLPGIWQVRVFYNDLLLLPVPDTFTISSEQNNCPTASNLNPSSGAISSAVTITGTGFTGVTAVKFANNVAASFTVNNDTTITAMVPSGAVTGPITISRTGCPDAQTPPFTVLVQPVIEVTPAALDFGNVNTGERAARTLMIRNIGNAPLDVSSIAISNAQFTTSLLSHNFSLFPGGSATFDVFFSPDSGGSKTGTLSINSNAPALPLASIPLTGTGLAPVIEVAPPSLAFAELALAESKDLSFTIRNTGTATLKINSIESSNPRFNAIRFIEKPSNAVVNPPLDIAPGASVEVTVRFRPGFTASSVGAQSGMLSINSNDPARPLLDLPVNGTGLGPLISEPPGVSFGAMEICSTPPLTANVTISNSGNTTLGIGAIYTDNPAFILVQQPPLRLLLAPGESLNLPLNFSTRSIGAQTGNLVVSSNAVNRPELRIQLSGTGTAIPAPSIGQLSVSRTTLSHGRADNVRPSGLAGVIGFAFPGAPLPPDSIAPGAAPPPLIGGFPGLPAAAIASAPDPLRITLAGGVANPIVIAAANIPSCFTLVVAEGITFPDLTRWDRVGSRFGSGNLYASVSIPGTAIVAGMELVTEADFEAYTANSIIYEAPDFGLLVAPEEQNGGTATLQARARRIPDSSQCPTQLGQPQTAQVEFARTVRIEILDELTTVERAGSDFIVTVTAEIFGNFDPATNTVVRWAFGGETVDIVIDANDMTPPGSPRRITERFWVPASEECKLAQVTAVASSTGNDPFVPPPINPFLEAAPATIGLFTFLNGGCTIEDTKAVFVRAPESNCGGGAAAGWISGYITDAVTGEPIEGAIVSVIGANISARTRVDGSYALNNVPAGVPAIEAAADGYSPQQVQVNLPAGQVVEQNIGLQPLTGMIRGVVLNAADNAPIAGASVIVKGTGIAVTTGSDGSYTLTDVPREPQTVSASAEGFNPEEAIVIVIGDLNVTQDFLLTPVTGTIAGIVRDAATAMPISGATVTAGGMTATTDGSGGYALNNVPIGAQSVNASAPDYNPASASVTVVVGAAVDQDFSLAPQPGTIAGFVKDDFAEPIAGATVTVAGVTVNTGADGSYTLTNIPAGAQTVNGSATGFVSASASVTVLSNQTVQQDLTLPRRTGTVQGRIIDESTNQPIAGAEVELLPFPLASAIADASGNYSMTGVPAGEQVILASAPGYFAKIAVVGVLADQAVTQDFALTLKRGEITGTVFDNLNQPIAGATVAVAGTSIATSTNEDGGYTLINVPAGMRTLNVSATGFTSGQFSVDVVANKLTFKDIYLQTPTGRVQGTVRNASNNEPIAGAQILVGIFFGPVYFSAFTDASGNYSIDDMPARGFTIYAGAEGFISTSASITVVANQTTTQNLLLTPVGPATGTVNGVVRNAANADPIVGATITIAGTGLSATTGAGGTYTINNVPAGAQTLNASATGFISTSLQVNVPEGQTLTQNISLSPTLPPGEIRITLNWNKDGEGHPHDLDAHLIGPGPDNTCFHVFYDNLGNLSAAPFARLEVDNIGVSGAPPTETIRISQLMPGIYRFYVHDFRGEKPDGLSRSGATVQIFGSGGQLGSFTVPNGAGFNWTVFEINGQTGVVTPINQLASPAGNCR